MRFPAHWVVDRPWFFIALFAVLTLAMATRLPGIEIDPEVKNQLPADMAGRLNIDAIEEVFGGTEMLMIVMESDDILAPQTLKRLRGISDDLQDIDSVDRVMGLFTLQDITGEDGMMVVESAIETLPKSADDRAELVARLQANPFVYGNVVAKDFTAAATIALLSTNASDEITTAAIQKVIDDNPGSEAVFIGGMPQVRVAVSRDIRADMRKFAPLGLLILLSFLYACFRQVRAVLLPFIVVVMSIVVAMGFIPVFGWKMQMVTVILPVILLAVANDYGIHLLAKYQEENVPSKDRTPKALATRVLEDLGAPVLAAGLTTMAGLLCLTTHIVVPAQQLGVLAAIGVGFALLASIGFIPAMLVVLPPAEPLDSISSGEGGKLQRLLAGVADAVIARPRTWIAGLLTVSAIAISGMVFLNVDTNPVNYYESTAPVAQISVKINKHFGGSTELAVMIEGDIQDPQVLRDIDTLEQKLQSLPQVGFTTSIAGIVRAMNQAVMGGGEDEDKLPDTRAAVAQYFLLYSMGGDPEDFERIVDFEYRHTQVTARINSLGTDDIALVVAATEAHLAAHPIGEKTIIGGFGPLFVDLVDAVVNGQVVSLSLSLFLVFVLVSITFQSPAAGMWSVVPLAIAIPVLFGLMGYWSIELNIVTAMLSSIMIGVGVDYTIHFLWRYRELRAAGDDPNQAIRRTLVTTGRGIVFNALSVIAGFAVLLISNFLPVKFFGFLVVVSISACLIGALVLLPAICLVVRPKFLEP